MNGGSEWFEPATNGDDGVTSDYENSATERIGGKTRLERDQRRGAMMVFGLCFLTGFVTQRYVRRKQLMQLDFLTDDKVIATFAKGRPIILSRVVS